MSYNYVVTAQRPTSVTQSVTGNFTGSNDLNLILSKSTRLEVHLMTSEGLHPQLDVNIYGRISVLEIFRPSNQTKDYLFICTHNHQFCVLEYDENNGTILTKAQGNIKDSFGRTTDVTPCGKIDPECRMIGLRLYESYYKVIPIDTTGALKEAYNIRLDEVKVLDIQFLYGYSKPTICVLYEDSRKARHVKTYHILLKEKEFIQGPWNQSNVDSGASILIPIPSPYGGVLIIGQQTIVYHNGNKYHAVPIQQTLIQVYGKVDKDGSRFLLADQFGQLHVIALQFQTIEQEKQVVGLQLEVLGQTSCASTLSYLDNGIVFVGSCLGDSQLIKLNPSRDEHGSYIELIDTYTNIGPIVDFCVMDLDRQGQGQIVTCSGAYKDGSLRVVRNGIGIHEQATVELPGIKGIWSLRPSFNSSFDQYLVQSYIDEIRVLCMEGEEMEECEIDGFSNEKSLCCETMYGNYWIQITEYEIRLIKCETKKICDIWKHSIESMRITVANANPTQIVLSTIGGNILFFEIENEKIIKKNSCQMENEISCININPLSDISNEMIVEDIENKTDKDMIQKEKREKLIRSTRCAIGLWTENSVCILDLPSLNILTKVSMGNGDILPRSVLLSTFEKQPYLLVGLGDGHLMNFRLNIENGSLNDQKKVSLGTQPITLTTFTSKDTCHVFASSDRPTVIYSSNNKLLYSNVNTSEVNLMCPFHSESFPECLALVSEETLAIGTIDDIQKLHIQTIPLGEWPRRICHHLPSHTLAVTTLQYTMDETGEEMETNYVRLFDDQTFELLDSHKLDPFEQACSIISCTFHDDTVRYVIVGTAFVHEEENEPHQGRILVFSITGHQSERKFHLISDIETRGAVYCMNEFNGKLLAGVNSKTQLYKWTEKEEGDRDLISECGHHGHIVVLYLQSYGDFIVVGDLMKSMSLLSYTALNGNIEEIARDLDSNWMAAVDILNEDIYIGADADYNIFTLKRNADAASDEERGRLELHGEYHIGEFINRFQRGSLVMQPADIEKKGITDTDNPMNMSSLSSISPSYKTQSKSLLYGSVNGTIGAILTIDKSKYQLFHRLQNSMTKVINGVGGFLHNDWRMYESRRRSNEAKNFVDGDLIELFLDLTRQDMETVVKNLNADGEQENKKLWTLEEVSKLVEEMSQLH